MAFSPAAKNYMLDQLGANKALYISIHSADPGTTGASELSGGSPAYARKAATWGSSSSGSKAITNQPVFDIPAAGVAAYFGLWDAATAGNFQGGGALSASETFTAQGTYTVTAESMTLT